jgi:serine/threonine protein kinase
MATGERAFVGENSISILSSVLRDDPKSIRQLTVESSDELEEVIRQCLRKDPAERWQSMDEVRQALEQLKEPSATSEVSRLSAVRPAELTSAPSSGGSSEPAKRSPLPMLAAAAVFLLAVAGGWWWFTRPAQGPGNASGSIAAKSRPIPSNEISTSALTNDRILEMTSARVPESLILSQIRNSHLTLTSPPKE